MLQSENIELGPISSQDSETLFTWINDSELVRLSSTYKPVHEWEHSAWFEGLSTRSDRVAFAIRLRGANADREPIGVVQLIDIHPYFHNAELVIRIGSKDHQGKGYGSEVLLLLLKYASNSLNLHRIYLHAFTNNKRAIAAYKKVGFKKEGVLEQHAFIDGKWVDVEVMGILL